MRRRRMKRRKETGKKIENRDEKGEEEEKEEKEKKKETNFFIFYLGLGDMNFSNIIVRNKDTVLIEGIWSVRFKLHNGVVKTILHVRYVPSCGYNLTPCVHRKVS